MKSTIQQLISDKTAAYRANYGEMLGDYNREHETIKGYNGRQLLELLQNCDDAHAERVVIAIDPSKRELTISNTGDPFTEKGYRSLFISNLSSKTSRKEFIGNKGLGFRAVIHWSASLEIISNNLSIRFSKNRVKDYFEQLFPADQRENIRAEENLADHVVPLPFLSNPLITEIPPNGYSTVVKITYNDPAKEAIYQQIKEITPELLLFLRHIRQIDFIGFEGKSAIVCDRTPINSNDFNPRYKMTFGTVNWSVFELEAQLPEALSDTNRREPEYFQVKLAVQQELKHSVSALFSFFPTQIQLNQPYILHASFDLDSTRNQINDSEKNRYILQETIALTIQVANYYKTNEGSYLPLRILNHNHSNDALKKYGYYNEITRAIQEENVFPCIDGTYRKLNEVIYLNEEFILLLKELGAERLLPHHIEPLNGIALDDLLMVKDKLKRSITDLENPFEILNKLAALDMTMSQRARFIGIVCHSFPSLKQTRNNGINLLVDDNGSLISWENMAFTPASYGQKLQVPAFARIQFINQELFDLLVLKLNHSLYKQQTPSKSRFIAEQLQDFCLIQSYEPANLANKCIEALQNELKLPNVDKKKVIGELYQALYANFCLNIHDEAMRKPLQVTVPTLNQLSEICQIRDTLLPDAFPSGSKSRELLAGVYSPADYMAHPQVFGVSIEKGETGKVEAFFQWLGVQQFAKYKYLSLKAEEFSDYKKAYRTRNTVEAFEYHLEEIGKIVDTLNLEQLIYWITVDPILIEAFSAQQSYLKFEFQRTFKEKYGTILLEDKFDWYNTIQTVDYNHFLIKELGKINTKKALIDLGATESIEQLTLSEISDLLERMIQVFPDGKSTSGIYKQVLSAFKNVGVLPREISLFADDGDSVKAYPCSQVYFSDKVRLPLKMKKNFPVFSFPLRAGGSEAIKFFRINDLKKLKIELVNPHVQESLTETFTSYFEDVKPFILALRIHPLENDPQKKAQATICKQIQIRLCSDFSYTVNGNHYSSSDFEFIQTEKADYVMKVPLHSTLDQLKTNYHFIDALTEILSASFDVTGEKNEYRTCLRENQSFLKDQFSKDFGEFALTEAMNLLGLADNKFAFWSSIARVMSLEASLFDQGSYLGFIRERLNVDPESYQIDYNDLNSISSIRELVSLLSVLGIEYSSFQQIHHLDVSMKNWHRDRIKRHILGKKPYIKRCVWKALLDGTHEKKVNFLNVIDRAEQCDNFTEAQARKYGHTIDLPLDAIFDEFVNSSFPDFKVNDDANPDEAFTSNLKYFSISEQNQIKSTTQLRSLVYFKSELDEIKHELKNLSEEKEKHEFLQKPTNKPDTPLVITTIDKSQLTAGASKGSATGSGGFSSPYLPSNNDSTDKKELGDKSELIAFNHLLTLDGVFDPYHVSKDNEGLHYDLRYRTEDNAIKYIEVKTFNKDHFFVSIDEFIFGLQNKEHYEIWLVRHPSKIIRIDDFYDNAKYQKEINQYRINLTLTE